MSLSDPKTPTRRALLLGGVSAVLLAGCGFRPVYGPGGTGQALRGAVRLDDPVSRADFQLVQSVQDILGRPETPRFGVAYDLAREEVGAGLVQGFGDTRVQLFATLTYTVRDLNTGAVLATGSVRGNSAYSTTGTQLATQAASEDAELRLMRMLADSLVTRLYTEPGLHSA